MDSRPTQPTKNSRAHLLERARAIVLGTQRPGREHTITYRISGGPPSRRLERTVEISGTGAVTIRQLDELAKMRAREFTSTLESNRVTELFKVLLESRLLENVDTGGGFLPDSVVGAITVSDGLTAITYYFHADEQKRRLTGTELNPSIARFSGALDVLAEEIMAAKRK